MNGVGLGRAADVRARWCDCQRAALYPSWLLHAFGTCCRVCDPPTLGLRRGVLILPPTDMFLR